MAATYRLQALLVLKQRLKKRAELSLARAIARLMKERERLKELESERDEIRQAWRTARQAMKASVAGGISVGRGNVHVNYLRKLKEDEEAKDAEIAVQREATAEAEKQVARARREYIDASRELQIMEKDKELWEKKLRGELKRAEAKKLNELGNTIHQLKRWRGEKAVFEL